MRLVLTLWIALAAVSTPTTLAFGDNDPALTFRSGSQTLTYRRSELLKRPDVTTVQVAHDPAYDQTPRTYVHAIPFRALLAPLSMPPGSTLQFECTDGFSAPLSREKLFAKGAGQAVPYLAVQAPGESWALSNEKKEVGPFYLIWKDAEKSKVGTEEWPFALSGFVVKEPVETSYPAIAPNVSESSPAGRGFRVFAKNCFACHTLNLQGQSKMGPDLNIPMSPTEYLSEANLRKLIRNPQNLRHWPESKMKGFSPSELSDAELSDLIAYLKHMASRRRAQKSPEASQP